METWRIEYREFSEGSPAEIERRPCIMELEAYAPGCLAWSMAAKVYGVSYDKRDERARLMVAAPEMLEALIAIVGAHYAGARVSLLEALPMCRDAIAKAGGPNV